MRSLTIWKKLIACLGVVIAAGGFGLIAAPEATATGNCYLDSCKGKDPHSSGCSTGAYTIALGIDLRYSSSCSAVWFRPSGGGTTNCTSTYIQVRRWYPGGRVETETNFVGVLYGKYWSQMAPMQASDTARFTCDPAGDSHWSG